MASDGTSGSSATNSRLNSRSEQLSNPYHLQNGDSPGMVLVSRVLIGSENYDTWSISMSIALDSKTKLAFVNGDILMPNPSDALYASWKRVNSMVISWILNSVSKEISSSIIYIKSALEMWNDLKERFCEKNNPRMFRLKKAICALNQDGVPVNTYFTRLKTLWEEYVYVSCNLIPHCSNGTSCCAAMKMYLEKEYTMQFLMGLDDSYSNLRSQILLNDPLPAINKVFASVIQEERRRYISPIVSQTVDPVAFVSKTESGKIFGNYGGGNSNSDTNTNTKNVYKMDKPICSYCGVPGHVVDKCYKLHEYPPGYKFKNKNNNQGNYAVPYGNQIQAASVQGEFESRWLQ